MLDAYMFVTWNHGSMGLTKNWPRGEGVQHIEAEMERFHKIFHYISIDQISLLPI